MTWDTPWALAADAHSASATDREVIKQALLRAAPSGRSILLDTCHRTELYGFGSRPELALPGVALHCDDEAVTRIVRIASGLESVAIGEDEVLHQVRQALKSAVGRSLLDHRLARLFETAIATGRKARAGRRSGPTDLASRAITWLDGRVGLEGRALLVVGAGRIGSELAEAGTRHGAEVTVASRRRAGLNLAEAARRAPDSAAVAIALGGPWEGLSADKLPPTADLSAPSAIPESVRRHLGAEFLGIDDLFDRPSSLDPATRTYVERATGLVEEATATYLRWLATRVA